MPIVYGVDTNNPITPKNVRDAVVLCFIQAHKDVLDEMKEFAPEMPEEEFEKFKRFDITQNLRKFFEEIGGDYGNPDKESIIKVLDKLKIFALNFRHREIVNKHYNEIMILVNKL